jgi:NAD(P)H-hydrate epimerase
MAARWTGDTRPFDALKLDGVVLVIDAVFGTGLSRPLDANDKDLVGRTLTAGTGKPILAVDVPSGMNPTSGSAQEWTVSATRTVTFFRHKTGHKLYPGRALCGELVVADIGIPDSVIIDISPRTCINAVPRDATVLPSRQAPTVHKYERGHAVVVSGPAHATGAARLAARGALRAGAGLVTVASPHAAVASNAAHLTAIMIAPFQAPHGLASVLRDSRRNAVLLGPGLGLGNDSIAMIAIALRSKAAVVLDADALSCFAGNTTALANLIAEVQSLRREVVLTPHEGEFARLTGPLPGSKLDRARALADATKAVVVLKGPDTVIARPDGFAKVNCNAPPWLATAGSGDVLAGFITGLLAQRMDAFDAACAAVWLHGACANHFGPGLIAEDIPEQMPAVLRALMAASGQPH